MVERPTAALRVADLIPHGPNICMAYLQVVVLGRAVCVCDFSIFVNGPESTQELFTVWANFKKNVFKYFMQHNNYAFSSIYLLSKIFAFHVLLSNHQSKMEGS